VRLLRRGRPPRDVLRALDERPVWAFDWDGTLIDSIARTKATYREIFRELDLPFDDALFERHYAPDWRRMYRSLGIPSELWPRIDRRWVEIFETEVSALVPGAAEALRWLRSQGRRMALVTAGHRERLELELRATGLVDMFETAVFGNEVPHQKPDPAPLLMAARYLRVEPAEIVLVADAPDDMLMAKRAGALPVGVLTGTAAAGSLRSSGARWIARDVAAVVSPLRDGR
jgi:HAD superfamily hydrolase (TIGR01509 family)